ncbi:MAG: 6-carboxytetrahydropterin synthase [Pseudomonadota bacterium]
MAKLFVDNLTVMDFSYLDLHRGVVGESWIVDIELAGELDEQGMVFDFGDVKKQIKRFIDEHADHRLLVPADSPGCETQIDGNERVVEFPLASGALVRHRSPDEAVLLLEGSSIDPGVIAAQLQTQLIEVLPENVQEVLITLRPESIEGAFFHYTHGLEKHQGQCQRIAHGHRSRLEISIDGERSSRLESHWAQRLADSYIATEHHVVGSFECNDIAHTKLAYSASQGEFEISLPRSQVFLIPLVSTVENIAIHLAGCVARDHAEAGTGQVKVKAFEGVGKGAFGTA